MIESSIRSKLQAALQVDKFVSVCIDTSLTYFFFICLPVFYPGFCIRMEVLDVPALSLFFGLSLSYYFFFPLFLTCCCVVVLHLECM